MPIQDIALSFIFRRQTISERIRISISRGGAADGGRKTTAPAAADGPTPYVAIEMLPNYLRKDIGLAPR